jgi:hypothetical protein
MSATHSRFGAVARKRRSTRSSQTRTPGTLIVARAPAPDQPRDPGPAHQARHALAADPLAVGHHQLGMDPGRSVDPPVGAVDLAHALGQALVLEHSDRRLPPRQRVIVRPADAEYAAHCLIECSARSAAMNRKITAGSRCPWGRRPPWLSRKSGSVRRVQSNRPGQTRSHATATMQGSAAPRSLTSAAPLLKRLR